VVGHGDDDLHQLEYIYAMLELVDEVVVELLQVYN